MSKDYVGIDKEFLPRKLKTWADRLEEDYWANLFDVLHEMRTQLTIYTDKMVAIEKHIFAKMVEEYGHARDKEREVK